MEFRNVEENLGKMPFLCQQWLGFWGPSSQHDIINGVNLTWTRQIRFAYRQRYLSTSLGLNQGSRKYGLYAIGNCIENSFEALSGVCYSQLITRS